MIEKIKKIVPKCIKNFIRIYIPAPLLCDLPVEIRRKQLEILYENKMNSKLDLDNPICFTEKVQWLKLYYKNNSMTRYVDKYEFKEYVKEKLGEGYTAKLLKVWEDPNEVSIKEMPYKKFVIKSTLQSDGIFVVPVEDINKININKLEQEIKEKWFDPRHLLINSFCSAYYNCKPRVIVEEFIEEFEGAANDYKLFCFNGEPEFCYVAEDHFKNGEKSVSKISFFDLNWNILEVKYGEHEVNPNVKKPYHFNQMLKIARILSKEFPFVRVDFFDTKEKLYLAELTFYPGGGLTKYYPEEFNIYMGNKLSLYKTEGET